MFNYENRVHLSEFTNFVEIVRDRPFFACGKIPSRIPRRLVPITTSSHLKEVRHYQSEIAVIVCPPDLIQSIPDHMGVAVATNPRLAANLIHAALCDKKNYLWNDFPSQISSLAKIHPSAHIDSRNVVIDDDTIIGPHAVILDRVRIGKGCTIGPNTTIGSSGYEVVVFGGESKLVEQAGGVSIGDNVQFLSNASVARSAFPNFTEIGNFSTFDNLTHIAHDCILGSRVKMAACSMLSGRVTLGDDVYIGPNATVSNGVTIKSSAKISIGAVVISDVEENVTVTGNFATEHRNFLRNMATLNRIKK